MGSFQINSRSITQPTVNLYAELPELEPVGAVGGVVGGGTPKSSDTQEVDLEAFVPKGSRWKITLLKEHQVYWGIEELRLPWIFYESYVK